MAEKHKAICTGVRALLLLAVIGSCRTGAQQSANSFTTSLSYSCLEVPFLSVALITIKHESFVDAELRLVDPLGHKAGRDSNDHQIPQSSYGKIVEIPDHPEISKAVAVEVCDPKAGTYEITVWEHSKGPYRIKVATHQHSVYYSDYLYPVAEDGRACHYKFEFRPTESDPIRWLDAQGGLLPVSEHPRCSPLQRASIVQDGLEG